MKAWTWVIFAAVGWGVMFTAYNTRAQLDPRAPWAFGMIVIGPELPPEITTTERATPSRLRLVPAGERTESILKVMNQVAKEKAANLELQLRPKLILLPLAAAGIDENSLQSGRLPAAGQDQIIAGPSAAHKDRLTVGDRTLDVVGVLKDDFALFRDDYLIPPAEKANAFVRGRRSIGPSGDPCAAHS